MKPNVEKPVENVFGCELVEAQRRPGQVIHRSKHVFADAEGMAKIMSYEFKSNQNEFVPLGCWTTGGWMCRGNTTENARRQQRQQQAGVDESVSSETFGYFSGHIASSKPRWTLGENVYGILAKSDRQELMRQGLLLPLHAAKLPTGVEEAQPSCKPSFDGLRGTDDEDDNGVPESSHDDVTSTLRRAGDAVAACGHTPTHVDVGQSRHMVFYHILNVCGRQLCRRSQGGRGSVLEGRLEGLVIQRPLCSHWPLEFSPR